jgi:hypothetical protein
MPTKLEPVYGEGEKYYISFSFDIDDFIGDGVWWLQIYDINYNLIYDKPFASSMGILDKRKAKRIIKEEFLTLKGGLI